MSFWGRSYIGLQGNEEADHFARGRAYVYVGKMDRPPARD